MIKFNDLGKQWECIKESAQVRLDNLFNTSAYILGPDVKKFEENFAKYIGAKYAVGVSNGTDALRLCYESLGLNGRLGIVIQANTYVATAMAAKYTYPNADIIFCDVDEYYEMDMSILENILKENRSKWDNCIITPVHMFGMTCNIESISNIAKKYNAVIIEDCSQAHGAECNGVKVGNTGLVNGFSCYPGKNLGAAGDAGVITTNDEDIYNILLKKRSIGSVEKFKHVTLGHNHRLDTLQAIILDEKLKHLDKWNQARIDNVTKVIQGVNNKNITFMKTPPYCTKNVYHVFFVTVNDRKHFQKYLNDNDVQSNIHYPIPIENMDMFATSYKNKRTNFYCDHAVSLPVHPFMGDDVDKLIKILNEYEID